MRRGRILTAAMLTLGWGCVAFGQQTETSLPSSRSVQGEMAEGQTSEPVLQPDNRPLAGIEEITLGTLGEGRSYLLPAFAFSQAADTNAPLVGNGNQKFVTLSIPVGYVALNKSSAKQQFMADYVGGGFIYETASQFNGFFQQFGFSETVKGRRAQLELTDRLTYLPETGFGFAGVGLAGAGVQLGLGGTLGNLNPLYGSEGTILTNRLSRYSNVAALEAKYDVSGRSTLSGVAAYDILSGGGRTGFISGNDLILSGSYDRALTPRDTFTLGAFDSQFHYVGVQESINVYGAQIGYGRRVTGRLAFKLLVGPEFSQITLGGATTRPRANAFGQARLEYQRGRTNFAADYLQHVTQGSGVYAGAYTYRASGLAGRQLSRVYHAALNVGYAHNKPLYQTALTPGPANRAFDYEFGGLRLQRPFGHYTSAFVYYEFQRQTSDLPFFGANGRVLIRHVFGAGFSVHPRPIGL